MKKSFTLIELIVVIAIIAILAAIIAPNAFKAIDKAKVSASLAYAKNIKTAILSLYSDTGHFSGWVAGMTAGQYNYVKLDDDYNPSWQPSNLLSDESGWTGWDGPYMEQLTGRHRWGGTIMLLYYPIPASWANGLGLYRWFPCYGNSANNCGVSETNLKKIDATVDDGVPTTGNHRVYYDATYSQWYSLETLINF
ncbi:MAG: prepilin-type N-terminal cleavage/methylation domain-containing protein [Candidatus Omnitrophica bacterium]|nr:prepilin-type N-terminal cleavage/methylation domain-containing protein [Candidatus Omnitrophota bacterium]